MNSSLYQIGGSLSIDCPTYVQRKADQDLYEALNAGHFCYVLNARQMGKSSLMVRTRYRLEQEGFRACTLDMTRIGSEMITSPQWYKGIVTELWRGFNLLGKLNLKAWWKQEEDVSVIQRLSHFIEDILFVEFPDKRLVIFVDEIDSILSLKFRVDDFFALIRFCYNQRAINPEYNRISFALFGVATPSDLIADRSRTPFNIGKAIELEGFNLEEVEPLVQGLERTVSNPKTVIREILAWTGGQPFLTQKICQLVLKSAQETVKDVLMIPPGTEGFWVESLVRSHIIYKWESQDEPEHLRTIRNRIEYHHHCLGRMLGIYQKMLQGLEIRSDDSYEQIELILSGLVAKKNGLIRVKNRIYQEVFDSEWVHQQLSKIRPYSQAFDAWIASAQNDQSRLLRGQALKEAQNWSIGRSISDLDYQFLAKSEELDRKEVQQTLEVEKMRETKARLIQEKQTAKWQRILLISVSFALLFVAGLMGVTYFQYRQSIANEKKSKINEIKALIQSSEALLASNQEFDGVIQALKANRQLKTLASVEQDTRSQVDSVLQKAIYRTQEYNRLSGHKSMVYSVQFSPLEDLIATASQDKTIKLWKPDGTLLKTLTGHNDGVVMVAFSPRNKLLASASSDKTIKLWNTDGTLLKTIQGHTEPVMAVSFSSQEDKLVSASFDKTIKLWTSEGKLLKTINAHQSQIRTVVFSPDGKLFASGSADKTIKLWNSDGTLLKTINAHEKEIIGLAFSPDNQTFASASQDKTVKLWSRDGVLLKSFGPFEHPVWGVAFSPNGAFLAAGLQNKEVKVWRKCNTEKSYLDYQTFLSHKGEIGGVAFSPDSQTLASASWDKTVKFWTTGEDLFTSMLGHQDFVWGVTFSPDGQLLASSSEDKTIKLWTRTGKLVQTLIGHSARVNQVEFSPDQQWLASTSDDQTIKLWKPNKTGQFEVKRTLNGHQEPVWDADFTSDSQKLATASWDKTVKLWRLDGTLLQTLQGHDTSVWGISLHPSRPLLVSSAQDGKMKLWNLNGELKKILNGHLDAVWAVEFSPDGELLVSGSRDYTLKLWRWNQQEQSYTEEKTMPEHTAPIMAVTISPDQQWIASASQDKTIKLWKMDGTFVTTLNGHRNDVNDVVFSPDGKWVASASADNRVILWNLDQVLKLNELAHACNWVKDYLKNNQDVRKEDRNLCTR